MKQFFKFMFASMLGMLLSFFLIFILFLMFLAGAIHKATKDKETIISSNSILHIELENEIHERGSANPWGKFDYMNFSISSDLGLNHILADIKKAEHDPNIKGIFLEIPDLKAGYATAEEIRNALADFKKSGKFLFAYAETYTLISYYVSSIADKVFVSPQGDVDFRGMKAELTFFKKTLDKLEVEPEIIRHGKFKSAVEPFIEEKMSDANRKQISQLIGSIWNFLSQKIAESRNISVDRLRQISSNFEVQNAEDAQRLKIVDSVIYKDQLLEMIRHKIHIGPESKINMVSLKKYDNVNEKTTNPASTNSIAIIYAEGDIVSGDNDDNKIGSEKISEAIRKARLDPKVKAIVLRVNSPGGSVLASDVIWREAVLANKAKPVVASYGDYAASGGYYISCPASAIVSQPTTITGSIGVFEMRFNVQKLLNNKIGITFDTVKTGKYSTLGGPYPLTPGEREILQRRVDKIYDDFITRVSNGRGILKSNVDSIGQGRVWSGIDGKRIRLVDELGGINEAIALAAKKAHITSYNILSLPEQKETFQKLMEEFSGDVQTRFFGTQSQKVLDNISAHFKSLTLLKGPQARLPYSITLY